MWTSLVPLPYRIGIIACLIAATFCTGWLKGVQYEKGKWQAADAKRIHAEDQAIASRAQANAAIALRQRDINDAITKANHEELAPVIASIAADRVRIGPALCGGPTSPAQAQSASGGNGPDPVASGLRDAAERDLAALKAEVATSLAAGRSCQAFVRDNGMAPISE